jgi:hypothetical protein
MWQHAAPFAPGNGKADFNSTTYEPWNTEDGAQPWSAIYDAWGGLTFDQNRGDAIVSIRAGHTASPNGNQPNSVLRFRCATDTPGWEHLKASSPYRLDPCDGAHPYEFLGADPGGDLCSAGGAGITPNLYSDGGPPGAHTFNNGVCIEFPSSTKVCFPTGAGAVGHFSNLQGFKAEFDLTTLEWTCATSPAGVTDNYDAQKAWPGTQRVYILSKASGQTHHLSYFDYATGTRTWLPTATAEDATILSSFDTEGDIAIDPTRNRILVFRVTHPSHAGQNKVLVIENAFDGPVSVHYEAVTGAGAAFFTGTQLNSAHYVRAQDKFYVLESGTTGHFVRFDAEDFSNAEYLGPAPITPTDGIGHINKTLHYSDGLGVFVYWPRFANNGYFLPVVD